MLGQSAGVSWTLQILCNASQRSLTHEPLPLPAECAKLIGENPLPNSVVASR
jgi:hypothetical protein